MGAGVAAPLWLGGWRDFLGAPAGVMDAWNEIDIRARIQALTQLPVEFAKDTTAACVAELVFGQGRSIENFLYLFIGTFVGGGLVIDGHLHPGPRGNAGAVGSVPLLGASRRDPQAAAARRFGTGARAAVQQHGACRRRLRTTPGRSRPSCGR